MRREDRNRRICRERIQKEMINRTSFFKKYRQYFGSLKQSQVDALNFLLDKLEQSKIITDKRHWAYILATIFHETAYSFLPVTEFGSQKYLKSKPYYPYIGRGYVQLTWISNYKKFAKLLNIQLVEKPMLANEPENAWKILELGMSKGLYTGKKLSDYINEKKTDYFNARRIINGTDKALIIQKYAEDFYTCLT